MPLLIHGSNVTTEVGAKPELIINFLITSCGEGEQRAADLGQRVRGDRARALEPGSSPPLFTVVFSMVRSSAAWQWWDLPRRGLEKRDNAVV